MLAHQDPFDEDMPRKSFEPLFPVPYALLDDEGRFVGSIRLAPEDFVAVTQTAQPLECVFVSYSDERGWAYHIPEKEATELAARYPGEGWPDLIGRHQYINAICIQRQHNGTAVRSSTAIVKFSREGWLRCKPKTEWIVLG